MSADTGGNRGGGSRRNPDGLKFRKVGASVYEVVAPWDVLGTVGIDRDGSWWANPDGVTGTAARTTEGWRNRERAAHSLLDDNGARAAHTTTVTEGGLSNFTVSCTCGKTWGVATAAHAFAEQSAAEHVAAHLPPAPDADPFAGLPS